jgi:hypothetical protein
MKKVIIVGNGLGCLSKKNGAMVDSCDVVIRIGLSVTEGFEEFVGTKTDILCSCLGKWPFKNAEPSEIPLIKTRLSGKQIWIPNDIQSFKDFPFVHQYDIDENNLVSLSKQVYTCQELLTSNLSRQEVIFPTTGYLCIESALEKFPLDEIYIMGFDGFRSGWYWEPSHVITYRNYSLIQESLNIRKYIREKKLIKLD